MKVPDRRLPLHVPAFLGCSTGAYALTLAGVTAVQSATDMALDRERAPMAHSLDAISSDHAALEQSMLELADDYDRLATSYAGLGPTFDAVETGLERIAKTAAAITKSAASMPTRVALPSMQSAPRRAAPPPTHASTGASG